MADVKAIFLDYTGTMVREDDEDTMKLLKIFLTNSDLKTPEEALKTVWGLIKKIDYDCYLDKFLKKDEMVDMILDICEKEYHFTGDKKLTHEIWAHSWVHAPLFDDVTPFFDKYSHMIYVVTNDDYKYVEESMKIKGLNPKGIISAESVRACKPHVEILNEALRVANVSPKEAVLIGDSVTSDVGCAKEAGIRPVIVDRKGRTAGDDFCVVKSLLDLEF